MENQEPKNNSFFNMFSNITPLHIGLFLVVLMIMYAGYSYYYSASVNIVEKVN